MVVYVVHLYSTAFELNAGSVRLQPQSSAPLQARPAGARRGAHGSGRTAVFGCGRIG